MTDAEIDELLRAPEPEFIDRIIKLLDAGRRYDAVTAIERRAQIKVNAQCVFEYVEQLRRKLDTHDT